VYINEHECGQLAEFLGSNPKEFKRRFTFVDDQGWRQLNFRQGRCVFLDADERCGVYAARPLQCRTFPFWPELIRSGRWTRQARRLCEGVGRGREVGAREVRERLEIARRAEEEG